MVDEEDKFQKRSETAAKVKSSQDGAGKYQADGATKGVTSAGSMGIERQSATRQSQSG